MKPILFYTGIALLAFFYGCRKDGFITSSDARISLSADTLQFDTVFTTAGSVTQLFKIINTNNQQLKIDEVALQGGNASAFKINADGAAGPLVKNIDLEANDSMYVFVTVSINPIVAAQPFIMRDSIAIRFNGSSRFVQLEAFGQNAHFLRNQIITGNTTWSNDLPYVILGGLQIDTAATLTIQKGCKVYLHADAPVLVDGTLKVNGEKADSSRVYFRGDRMDYPYNEYPAAWPGIYFRSTSKDNIFQYAVIQNAYQGLVAQQPAANANPKLTLNECIVDNVYDAGLYGIETSIKATNCLISNCGKNVQLLYGGSYHFIHCTMAAMANGYIAHKDPVLYISNGVQSAGAVYTDDMTADFTNCIIWADNGTAENEVVTSKLAGAAFTVNFTSCLWKVKTDPGNLSSAVDIINNQDPVFDSINASKRIFNFRLKENSPAINKGIDAGIVTDLDGNPRPVAKPDLGAYEKQ